MEQKSIYQRKGYESRKAYLVDMAVEYGLTFGAILPWQISS